MPRLTRYSYHFDFLFQDIQMRVLCILCPYRQPSGYLGTIHRMSTDRDVTDLEAELTDRDQADREGMDREVKDRELVILGTLKISIRG